MRRALSCLLLLPFLSGCDGPSTQEPLRPLTDAELRPYYVDSPRPPLPGYTAFTLGESYQPTGTVKDWNQTKVVPLYARADRNLVPAGQVQPDGRMTGTAPLKPGRTETLQFLLSTGGSNAWQFGVCVVDGLKATAGVNVIRPASQYFVLRLSDLRQGLQPLTSPVPTERVLGHDLQAYETETPFQSATSTLVYVSEDVTVQGEQRCLTGFEQGTRISVAQDNIYVNLKLTRGWNALVRLSEPAAGDRQRPEGSASVTDVVWTTVPHEVIERWR